MHRYSMISTSPMCVCAAKQNAYCTGTVRAHTANANRVFLNWLCFFLKRQISELLYRNQIKIKPIGNVLKKRLQCLLFSCVESASRVTVCRRRLVYGAKIYTYTHLHIHTDTHTRALIDNTYRRIHCKCRKFLLLSFVSLFVCIAPSVLRCMCVYECMHLCASVKYCPCMRKGWPCPKRVESGIEYVHIFHFRRGQLVTHAHTRICVYEYVLIETVTVFE